MFKNAFDTACGLYYNWQNGDGVSQSEVMCFCWNNGVSYDQVEDFVDENTEAYQTTDKTWNELFAEWLDK